MGRTVDPGFARLVAMKRIATGVTSLVAGVVLAVLGVTHHGSVPAALFLGVAIFFVGGAWTLRDGLRLRREVVRFMASR